MRRFAKRFVAPLAILVCLSAALAQARDEVLTAIPADALGFVVINNLSDASGQVDRLAQTVGAPPPSLLAQAKRSIGVDKGLDEQGALAMVFMDKGGGDPQPAVFALVPYSNFNDLVEKFNPKDIRAEIVEAQLNFQPHLIAKKGGYAVLCSADDRHILEKFLASKTSIAADNKPLAEWIAANKASAVLTSTGAKKALPKMREGLEMVQQQIRQTGGEQGETVASTLNAYQELIKLAERDVTQLGVGVRCDDKKAVDLTTRISFAAGGAAAKIAAESKPAADLLKGMPPGQFVVAFAGVMPTGAMEGLMKFSGQMMQAQPGVKMTKEQAEKYVQATMNAMKGVRSMSMVMRTGKPGDGLYGNTSAKMGVDDAKSFMEGYEKSLAAMSEILKPGASAIMPSYQVKRTKADGLDVLEVAMDFSQIDIPIQPGAPNMKDIMKALAGPGGSLKAYMAAADEHTIVMAYTSLDKLKEAIAAHKSGQAGLAADPSIAKTAAALPAGAQWLGYLSLGGVRDVAAQMMGLFAPQAPFEIPEFPASPPIGFAIKVSETSADMHLVVPDETLKAIGEFVMKVTVLTQGGVR